MKRKVNKKTNYKLNATFQASPFADYVPPPPGTPVKDYSPPPFLPLPGQIPICKHVCYEGEEIPQINLKNEFYYPEYIAKGDNTQSSGLKITEITTPGTGEGARFAALLGDRTPVPACSNVFINGMCGNGHYHLKSIVCGREWCQDCGEKDSISHNRRKSRWWGKLLTFDKVGYLVITIPEELRDKFKDKKNLTEFRTYIRRKLQRTTLTGKTGFHYENYSYTVKKTGKKRTGRRKILHGYKAGFIRFHWAGDCQECKGKGCLVCQMTGAGREFKPHLNILINEGFVDKKLLNKFKNEVSEWFKTRFELSQAPKGNIFYNYCNKEAQKIHKLNYVTRATWRFWEPEVTKVIKGFRTSQSWGKFNIDKKITSATAAGEHGLCIHCLEDTGEISKINWTGRFNRTEIFKILPLYRNLENGYYTRFTDIEQVMKN